MGYTGKLLKKLEKKEISQKAAFPQNTNTKIVSMTIHRKEIRKQNPKKTIFYRKSFPQNFIPNIVSVGSTGKILRNNGKNKISKKYHFQKKLSRGSHQG